MSTFPSILSWPVNRRRFLGAAGLGVTGLALSPTLAFAGHPSETPKVRIGFVGVGMRGMDMLRLALNMGGVEVPAVCDIVPERNEMAQRLVVEAGQPKPEAYGRGPEDYIRLVERNDLDAVFTATPWRLHTPVMVAAMKAGKYGGTEMPACSTIEEAWELVETSEQTGMPCMLLENYCYMRDVQMILNMARQGAFGDLSHCEVGYQHDTRYVTISKQGELLWRAHERALYNNGNRYPTHAVGPAAQWTNINRGNRFEYLVSMSSRSQGLNHYAARVAGPEHPSAKIKYTLGDVNTSLIMTSDGITITVYYDPQTPRPVDFIWRIQGTRGIYSGTLNRVHLEDRSPEHQWEEAVKYRKEYDHPNWKKYGETALSHGHGGSEYLCFLDFVVAIRNRTQFPIDDYDAVTWSVVTTLSENSVNNRSRPEDFPDFTRGQWKTRKPLTIETI